MPLSHITSAAVKHCSPHSVCLLFIIYRQFRMLPQDLSLGLIDIHTYPNSKISSLALCCIEDTIYIFTLTYRALHGQAPAYVADFLHPNLPTHYLDS